MWAIDWSSSLVVSRDRSSKVGFEPQGRRPTAHRPICHSGLTLSKCSYSGTWSWVKLVSAPESPPLGLHDTVQLHRLLHVKYCAHLGNYFPYRGSTRYVNQLVRDATYRTALFIHNPDLDLLLLYTLGSLFTLGHFLILYDGRARGCRRVTTPQPSLVAQTHNLIYFT